MVEPNNNNDKNNNKKFKVTNIDDYQYKHDELKE